jgi:hypothetical protein
MICDGGNSQIGTRRPRDRQEADSPRAPAPDGRGSEEWDMKTKKNVRCDSCGMKYDRRRLRCPHCDAENPHASPSISARDQLFGFVLLGLGVVSLVGVVYIMFFLGGASRVLLLRSILFVIPVGLIFQGVLFLMGMHPRDFFEWWNNRSPTTHYLVFGGLAALITLAIILYFVMDRDDERHLPDDLEGGRGGRMRMIRASTQVRAEAREVALCQSSWTS